MVQVGDVVIGEGVPKICVSIMEKTQEQILDRAQEMDKNLVDIVEWRVDAYEHADDLQEVVRTAGLIKSIVGKTPLLFTFRTAKEGGEREISFPEYEKLLREVVKSGNVDMADVEIFRGYDKLQRTRKEWRAADTCNQDMRELLRELSSQVIIVGSYHDFEKTPAREEILRRLFFMEKMGADIPKIAVMPQEKEDVICLMEATLLAKRLMVDKPIITMSMGALGRITRLAGECFGSAVTFGCMGKPSAPGQMEISGLKESIRLLH